MNVEELRPRLNNPDKLEPHLQDVYVENVIERGDDHPHATLEYYGSPELNVSVEDIPSDEFTLDRYSVTRTSMGTIRIKLRASTMALVPTTRCEYGPGGHDIELANSGLVYKATVTSDFTHIHLNGQIFVGMFDDGEDV